MNLGRGYIHRIEGLPRCDGTGRGDSNAGIPPAQSDWFILESHAAAAAVGHRILSSAYYGGSSADCVDNRNTAGVIHQRNRYPLIRTV